MVILSPAMYLLQEYNPVNDQWYPALLIYCYFYKPAPHIWGINTFSYDDYSILQYFIRKKRNPANT